MNSDTNDLVDFAILPQSRVQSYETTIDEQKEAIEKLKAEIENLEKSNQLPVEDKKSQICDTKVLPSNSVDDEKVKDEEQPSISPPAAKVTETFPETVKRVEIGRNINRKCLAQQLKHKLNETSYAKPSNIDALVAGAISTSAKKSLPHEEEFYQALKSNNLISLIKNKNKFDRYIRKGFFKV